MKAAIIALTRGGSLLALNVGRKIKAHIYLKVEFIENDMDSYEDIFKIEENLSQLIGKIFNKYDAIVFIMASGIVVRTIASYIVSKTKDPAVVVMDEKGQNVISLLSGHIGGANHLSKIIAKITGGNPVITTATDVNDVLAFDMFALYNNCEIENIESLKYISAKLVNGGKVGLYTDYAINGSIPCNIAVYDMETFKTKKDEDCCVVLTNRTDLNIQDKNVLILRPKNLVLGLGCKRGTSKENIRAAVYDFMKVNKRSIDSVRCIATIDLKQDENGLVEFCKEMGIFLEIIPRIDIEKIEGSFKGSDFVKEKTGVSGVAEPCACLSSGGKLICKKTVYKGITLALAEEEKVLYI